MKINIKHYIWIIAALAWACDSSTNSTQTNQKPNQPNIVILFSDELAPDYLSTYGGPYAMPQLDKLASSGTRFDRAYTTASMCTPSRFSLMTGQYPGRCQHPEFMENNPETQPYSIAWNVHLDQSTQTLAKTLSANGYITGMAGKWHIGSFEEANVRPKFAQGDNLDDPEVNQKLIDYQNKVIGQVKKDGGFDYARSVLWGNFDGFPHPKLKNHNFPWITKGAIDFLEQQNNNTQPFFLYVATTALHGPDHEEALDIDVRYTPAGKIDEVVEYQPNIDSIKTLIAEVPSPEKHKRSGLAYLDHHIGTIMNKLNELDLRENTIVIFMADHNVEPGKATCYERGIQVPFVINWPGNTTGTINDQLVQSIDIFPTLLEISNIENTTDLQLDGISILPALKNEPYQREYLFTEAGYARSVLDDRFKYIAFKYPEDLITQMKTGEIDYAPNQLGLYKQSHSSIAIESYPAYFAADQLYDLQNDPYEQNNLADQEAYHDKLQVLKAALKKHLDTFNHPYDLQTDPFRETDTFQDLMQKTKSLGTDYIPWLDPHHGQLIWPPQKRNL